MKERSKSGNGHRPILPSFFRCADHDHRLHGPAIEARRKSGASDKARKCMWLHELAHHKAYIKGHRYMGRPGSDGSKAGKGIKENPWCVFLFASQMTHSCSSVVVSATICPDAEPATAIGAPACSIFLFVGSRHRCQDTGEKTNAEMVGDDNMGALAARSLSHLDGRPRASLFPFVHYSRRDTPLGR